MTLEQIVDLRKRAVAGQATDDEIAAAITSLRQSRAAAGGTAKGGKKAKAEVRVLDDSSLDAMLGDLAGL